MATIGAAFQTRIVTMNNQSFKYQIWDVSGPERFRSLSPIYYRNAIAGLLVFDLTRKETFDNVKRAIEDCKQYNDQMMIVLIGNKSDLLTRKVTKKQVHEEVLKKNYEVILGYFETSAKTGENVEEAHLIIASLLANCNSVWQNESENSKQEPANTVGTSSWCVSM